MKVNVKPVDDGCQGDETSTTKEKTMGVSEILGIAELKTGKLYRAVAAEFVGMIMFLLCVTTVALGWNGKTDGSEVASSNVEISIGIGLAIASHAQAFGHVSGGHL